MIVSIYISRQPEHKPAPKQTNPKTAREIAKLQKLLKADYDSYGKELGLNGFDACKQYNYDDKSICDLIYEVR